MSKENRVSDERLTLIAHGIAVRLEAGASGAPDLDRDIASAITELLSLRSKPVAGVEVKPELLEATSSLQDISFRANELGIGLAKYPVAEIEAVLQFVSHALSTLSLPAQAPVLWWVVETMPSGVKRWQCVEHKGDAHKRADDSPYPSTVIALYASPQPEAVITDEMVERLRAAIISASGSWHPSIDQCRGLLDAVKDGN